jgi:hypothetical protein
VWIISIFIVVTSIWGLLFQLLIRVGAFPVPEQQQAMLRSQSTASVVLTLVLTFLNLVAAIWLWLLRKRAFDLFVTAFAVSLIGLAWQFIGVGPLSTLAGQGLLVLVVTIFSAIVGWGISLAICLYAWRLRQRGVLQ